MRPEFSFIITARNEGPALATTLAHLDNLPGNRSNHEIVLVDDASDVPVSSAFNLDGVRSCRLHQRQGVARAANIGATMASGQYLIFIDAHVCFNQSVLDDFRAAFKQTLGQAILGCATYMLEDLDAFALMAYRHPPDAAALPEGTIKERRYGWQMDPDNLPQSRPILERKDSPLCAVPYVPNCALAVKRDVFAALQGFDNDLVGFGAAQDCEFCARAWTYGYAVNLLPDTICYHYTAPRCGRDYTRDNPLERLDPNHYGGLTLNELRIPFLYFSREKQLKSLVNVARRCEAECVECVTGPWMDGFVEARASSGGRRTYSAELVENLMTGGYHHDASAID